jgi:SAM-dependent methyltransferase
LGFLDPRPSRKDLRNLYSEEYFAVHYDRGVEPDTPEFENKLRLKTSHIRFFRHIKPKGRVLDIGCGNGYFLAACKEKGYEVQGIDVSPWAAQYASCKLGLAVDVGEVEEVDLPSRSFDIVTMWHCLEHTHDPNRAVSRARSWLKRDGILIVEVPNYEGTDARKTWQDWEHWDLPYHLYHFTPQTLMRLLRGSGFDVVKTKDYHSEVIKTNLKRVPGMSLFARLIARIYSGSSVVVASKLIT